MAPPYSPYLDPTATVELRLLTQSLAEERAASHELRARLAETEAALRAAADTRAEDQERFSAALDSERHRSDGLEAELQSLRAERDAALQELAGARQEARALGDRLLERQQHSDRESVIMTRYEHLPPSVLPLLLEVRSCTLANLHMPNCSTPTVSIHITHAGCTGWSRDCTHPAPK